MATEVPGGVRSCTSAGSYVMNVLGYLCKTAPASRVHSRGSGISSNPCRVAPAGLHCIYRQWMCVQVQAIKMRTWRRGSQKSSPLPSTSPLEKTA